MKILNSCMKKLWLPVALSAGLGCIQSAYAGNEGVNSKSTTTPTMENNESVKETPPFQDADKNGDHYVTKNELKDYPYLLKHFDKVDAGEDGRLEEHEYQNLGMETQRQKGQ
jgi:hypothetical protein